MSIDAAIATTKKAAPEELMWQEAAYLAALPKTATHSIEGGDLWLRDADGAALAHYVAAPHCPQGSQAAAPFSKRILHIAYSSGTAMG